VTLRLSQLKTRRNLARPARNAHAHWSARSVRIITLESGTGLCGLGEAAPLPGFSPDTDADCERALGELDLQGVPEQLGAEQSLLAELGRASSRLPSALPAARCALEAALLDLWSRAAGVPAWAMLRADRAAPPERRVAALLMGEPEQALEQALAARGRGVNAFKLKVGRAGLLERELAAFARLRAELPEDTQLRLDANRAWPANAALAHLQRFAAHVPEFIEEPCAFAGLEALSATPVPLALDESLATLPPEGVLPAQFAAWGVRALIVKPTLLGGISACSAWARIARECGAELVLSHAFEGPLGLALSAALALSVGSERMAHGLDLEGARLEHLSLPFFDQSRIRAWSAPGFGELEQAR
jgi:o-succinylbenzoate synthase